MILKKTQENMNNHAYLPYIARIIFGNKSWWYWQEKQVNLILQAAFCCNSKPYFLSFFLSLYIYIYTYAHILVIMSVRVCVCVSVTEWTMLGDC